MTRSLDIQPLPASAAADAALVEQITTLVNEVYADAEKGLWLEGTARTTPGEVATFIGAGQLAVARLGGRIVGCVRGIDVDNRIAEFGLLAAAPDQRGVGIGRELVRFAEDRAVRAGRAVMRLELLVPRAWAHPSKEFLAAWYNRLGYRIVGSAAVADTYPHLVAKLATACDFVVYHKDLTGPQPLTGSPASHHNGLSR